jgi:hypothetical protein
MQSFLSQFRSIPSESALLYTFLKHSSLLQFVGMSLQKTMIALSFIAALLGLHATVGVHAQRVEINFGNNAALDLMKRIGAAQRAMDYDLAEQLKKQLNHLRKMPLEDWSVECSVVASLEADIFVANDPSDPPEEIKPAIDFLDQFWRTDDGG